MYTNHTYCRACEYAKSFGPPGIKSSPSDERLIEVFDLGLQPLANDFCEAEDERAGFAPLKVLYCPRCSLAQLSATVNPSILYSRYSYVTSPSATMLDHFNQLWRCIRERQPNAENVLEIGSNDGRFLEYLKNNGAEHVLGIDPAQNLASIANEKGLQTICGIFDQHTASIATSAMPSVDVVIARHVFCHMDDWHRFMKNLDTICQKNTLIAIEVPYVMDLLRRVQFDTIYHEHLSYLNIRAMQALVENSAFKLDHIQHFPIHGGAIVVYLRRRDHEGETDDSVEWYLSQEKENLNEQTWQEFSKEANYNIISLQNKVNELLEMGNSICGFGASAKSTVWINACKFDQRHIRFITDTTPQKQWKYSPGTGIRIVDEGALLRELPNYAILFSWNFRTEILSNNELYLRNGGAFIVPVPILEIVKQ